MFGYHNPKNPQVVFLSDSLGEQKYWQFWGSLIINPAAKKSFTYVTGVRYRQPTTSLIFIEKFLMIFFFSEVTIYVLMSKKKLHRISRHSEVYGFQIDSYNIQSLKWKLTPRFGVDIDLRNLHQFDSKFFKVFFSENIVRLVVKLTLIRVSKELIPSPWDWNENVWKK